MSKRNGVNYSLNSKVIRRRKSVIERLTAQLEDGMKPDKSKGRPTPLTDSDIKRIKRELVILSSRLEKIIR